MKSLRSLSVAIGVGSLIIGVAAVLSGGGTMQQVADLGHTLINAGAILIAAAVIGAAISERR